MREPKVTQIDVSTVGEIERESVPEREGILAKANVVGIGVGTKVEGGEDSQQACVKVLVNQKLPPDMLAPEDMVGPVVGGYPTDVEEVGELLALTQLIPDARRRGQPESNGKRFGERLLAGMDSDVSMMERVEPLLEAPPVGALALTQHLRPARGGFSVGHFRITAGTIATCVIDASAFPGIPPKFYILSNNHVLANSNNANIGDPILQPGPHDGGTFPAHLIARLSRYIPIRFGGADNYVDAAIAEGPFHSLDRDIYWIGHPRGVRAGWPSIGEIVQKTGRTTNYTTGRVMAINATVNVNFGGGRVARFVRQIVTTNMSAGGDSGSLVLDLNEQAVGLLFAGSSVATIACRADYVERLLGIKIA